MRGKNLPTASQLGIPDVAELVKSTYMLKTDLRGDELYFLCPVHEDHSPSASVNVQTGWWNCWVCGSGGDIINLGTRVLKMSRMTLEASLTGTDAISRRHAIIRACEVQKTTQTVSEEPDVIDRIHDPDEFKDGSQHPYLLSRGFFPSTLRHYGVRFTKRTSVRTRKNKLLTLKNVVCIPIHDTEGNEIIGWCFRSTPESPVWQPRYFYTTGFQSSRALFGEHLCKVSDFVVVTEGQIDSMWVYQAGFQAIATFGSASLSTPKIERLSDFKVRIFGDRDDAGITFTTRLGDLLVPRTSVRVVRYRREWRGTDPNELSAVQIAAAIRRAIPFHEWRYVI